MFVPNWHCDPSLQTFFKAEMATLEGGLDGAFEMLESDTSGERVVVIGKLFFYSDKNSQPIKITFPTKYPKKPPKIIALEEGGNGEILSNKPKLFGKGNQYNDGALCLLREEDWNSTKNIGWMLKRAQKWLKSAISEGGFKEEELVAENPPPLPPKGQVLLPKVFEPPKNLKKGQLRLTQFKPNHFIMEDNKLPEKVFNNPVNEEIFTWYKIETDLTFKELFPQFSYEILINTLGRYLGLSQFPVGANNIANIGIYLPNDPNKWHFFKVQINQQGIGGGIYLIAKNISEELYLRSQKIFDDQILSNKRVTIIGLGAIGSEVGHSLAKNGVGHFNLFDSDHFELGNSIRHAADLFHIGEFKTKVVKDLIKQSNPNLTVNDYQIDILDDQGQLESSLAESDLCIVLTAEDEVEYFINEKLVPNFPIPFVFARVSEGGFSGAIQVVQHQKTPCLKCLSLKKADSLPKPKGGGVQFEELGPEYGSCSAPPMPGSEIDTKEVALQVARVSLQHLLEGEKGNYPKAKGKQFYWHGPFGSEKQPPFTWEMKNLKPARNCDVCQ